MKNLVRRTFLALSSCLILSSCATGSSARVEYDPEFDFGNYRSFAWESENPMKVVKAIAEPRDSLQPQIMASIQTRLESAGYEQVSTSAEADFLLSFTVGSREISAAQTAGSPSADTSARGGWATAYQGGSNADYAQGMLAIDIADVAQGRPVWRGMHGFNILHLDQDYVSNLIDSAVDDILSNFPPDAP